MQSSVTFRFIEKVIPDANQMLVPSSWAFPSWEPEANKLVFFRSYLIRNVVLVTGSGLDKGHDVCNFSDDLVEKLLYLCALPTYKQRANTNSD